MPPTNGTSCLTRLRRRWTSGSPKFFSDNVLVRECFTQHFRCERPFHESWHKCVHEAIHSARNYSGPVFPERVKALGYALLHTHRLDPRVEPKLGQHRPLYEAHLIAILRINSVF